MCVRASRPSLVVMVGVTGLAPTVGYLYRWPGGDKEGRQ
jgi:hypothetical protein